MFFRSSLFLLFAVTCSCISAAQNNEPGNTRPNIIFILADDLGYKDLHCYGNPYIQTPNLDALARKGMMFMQAYVASPICSPSRAAIMTGKHPARLHLTNYLVGLRTDPDSPLLPAPFIHYLPASETTLPELLKKYGYTTGIVGKWHLGDEDSVAAFAQGFDYDRVIGKNGLDYYNYSITSRNKDIYEDFGESYLTDKLTDYGIEFIDQNREGPFFLYLAYSAPHVLIVPRADKLRKYLFQYNTFNGQYNPYYAAVVESLDDGVGRIVQKINSLNLESNTLVIFTSDNGGLGMDELGPVPTCNEPLRGWKGDVYEGGIRVPLILSWPGKIGENMVNENYITGTDYLPTIMELLGVGQMQDNPDGKSFLDILYNPEANFHRGPVFWHYPHFSNQGTRPAAAVRLDNYKLVERYETGGIELYDLSVDLSESSDLSTKMPDKKMELYNLLVDWRKNVNANMPLINTDYK